MQSNYDACLKKVLEYEGGYTNHPSDPGGPTNWGITIHDARAYWKANATAADVKAMPLSIAKEIYRTRYWNAVSGDGLPAGVDLVTFDAGVNSGVSRGLKWLKQAQVPSATNTIKRYCAARLSFLQNLRTWEVFGKGWGRRVHDVEATGLRMAGATRAELDSEEAKSRAKGAVAGAGAGGAAGTSPGVVDWLHQLDPSTKLGLVLGGLLAAGGVLYIAWMIYHNMQRATALNNVAVQETQ